MFNQFLIDLEEIIDTMMSKINTFTKNELYQEMGFSNNQITDGLTLLKNTLN